MNWQKTPYPYQKPKMPVLRSERVAIRSVLTFHDEVDGPIVAWEMDNSIEWKWDKYIAKKNKIDKFLATGVSNQRDYDLNKFELDQELLTEYYNDKCVATNDISKWKQISLRRTYIDNLTNEVLLREYVGRYVKVCENKYEKEEFIQNYMKKGKGCDPREARRYNRDYADRNFFRNFKKDHFDFRFGW